MRASARARARSARRRSSSTVAALDEGDERVVEEAADLVYHLYVLLAARGLDVARSTTCCAPARSADRRFLDPGRGLGDLRVEPFELRDQDLRDCEIPRPVVVGGNDVPRRPVGGRLAQDVLVGGCELVPFARSSRSLARNFQRFSGSSSRSCSRARCSSRDRCRKTLTIAVPSSVSVFSNPRICSYRPRHTAGREFAHTYGDDVLVVRAVEDHDLAAGRTDAVDPPEVVVRELVDRRRLERRTRQPCGLTPVKTLRIVPSFPDASIPCSTSSTARVDSAYRRLCRTPRRSTCCSSRTVPSFFPGAPTRAPGSRPARCGWEPGSMRRSSTKGCESDMPVILTQTIHGRANACASLKLQDVK